MIHLVLMFGGCDSDIVGLIFEHIWPENNGEDARVSTISIRLWFYCDRLLGGSIVGSSLLREMPGMLALPTVQSIATLFLGKEMSIGEAQRDQVYAQKGLEL